MTAQSGLGFSGIVAIQIPDDGAPGTVLTKITADNYDYDWLAGGGGASTIIVEDEGAPVGVPADTLNFVGAGVTAAGAGTTKTITIPGGGGPASTDWLEFVSQAINPGVVAANTLYQDDGSNFDVDTVAMGDLTIPMMLTTNVGFGDPGTEQGGILLNGANYDAHMKVNDIGGILDATLILHRHSTVAPPILTFSRSNSDTAAHLPVTLGQTIGSIIFTGWTGASGYDFGAVIDCRMAPTGTISATSSPAELAFFTVPDGSNIALVSLILGSDQVLYGDITPGGTLTLQGSQDADRGRILANGGITIDWDWSTDAVTTGAILISSVIPASGGLVSANITINNTVTVNAALFIMSALDDLSTLTWVVAPGFAVTTLFFARQTYRSTTPGIAPAQAYIYAAQCQYDIQGAGAVTVSNYRALSFAPILRARNGGDSLTITNVTGVHVGPLWNTNNAAATVNFGNIRGVHLLNPGQVLFGQSLGTETSLNIIGLDVNNLTIATTGVRAAVRSAITAVSSQNFFLQNTGGAESEFGFGDIHLNDDTWLKLGNTLANPDIIIGWQASQAAIACTFFGLGNNPLYLRPAATDTWTFQQNNLGTADIGLGFNVNAVSFGVIDPIPNSNNWFVRFEGPNNRQAFSAGVYSDVWWTAGGTIDVNGLALTEVNSFRVDANVTALNGGSVQDQSGLFLAGMGFPGSGLATRIQSLRVTGRARVDGAMNFGSFVPAQITANQNNYQLGISNAQRSMNLLDSDADYNITGIDSAGGNTYGQPGDMICLYNEGAFNLSLTNEDVLSLAANRFITVDGEPFVIGPNERVWLWYDDTGTARWRVLDSLDNLAVVITAAAALTLTAADDTVFGSLAGNQTFTLPDASTVNATGKLYRIKKTGLGGTLTVDTTAAQTIDGALTAPLTVQYEAITVQSDGANWNIM